MRKIDYPLSLAFFKGFKLIALKEKNGISFALGLPYTTASGNRLNTQLTNPFVVNKNTSFSHFFAKWSVFRKQLLSPLSKTDVIGDFFIIFKEGEGPAVFLEKQVLLIKLVFANLKNRLK